MYSNYYTTLSRKYQAKIKKNVNAYNKKFMYFFVVQSALEVCPQSAFCTPEKNIFNIHDVPMRTQSAKNH